MDAGVQQNATLVEEIASAVGELSLVANGSMEMIGAFRTREMHSKFLPQPLPEH
jgi:methyl-accepting chemotaxis protein